jgi:hypothetical protein
MRAVTMLIVGMMVMPSYGLMGKRASARETGGLLGASVEKASMLTPQEEGQMRTDPSFEDWIRTFQPRIRGGELSREQAIQMHMERWPGSDIHQGPEPSRRPKPRKDI